MSALMRTSCSCVGQLLARWMRVLVAACPHQHSRTHTNLLQQPLHDRRKAAHLLVPLRLLAAGLSVPSVKARQQSLGAARLCPREPTEPEAGCDGTDCR